MQTNILNVQDVEKAVYKLCYDANTCLEKNTYNKILEAYSNAQTAESKNILHNILLNAFVAHTTKTPLCQDTGQVLVFVELGENIQIVGNLKEAINNAVRSCYKDNFFRKSVVKNAIFDRTNTNDNTQTIINIDFIKGNQTKITVLIKGAGSENKSRLNMMLPTSSQEDIKNYIVDEVLKIGENSCPPMFIGIGAGGTMEQAAILSKKALFTTDFSFDEQQFASEIKKAINEKVPKKYQDCYVLAANLLTTSTHMASLPIAITVNCHSLREASCLISNGEIIYNNQIPEFRSLDNKEQQAKEILTNDIDVVKALKSDEEVLLTGEIYVARDAAHKRMFEMYEQGEQLPFDPKDKIIFYAGPSPTKPNEIIGAIGPTTSGRMDKYALWLHSLGLLATIGKGERSQELQECLKSTDSVYFTVQGGIAALLKNCVEEAETIAFSDLGAEAVLRLKIKKLPAKVSIT